MRESRLNAMTKRGGRPPKFRAERFEGLPCTAKLIWYFLRDHPGEPYSIRALAESLGATTASVQKALKGLVERGLIEVLEAPAGSRPGRYRAVSGVLEFSAQRAR